MSHKALERTLAAYKTLFLLKREEALHGSSNLRDLIRMANADLYEGPSANEEEGENYPGFKKATDMIAEAMSDVGDLWVNPDFEGWSETEPTWVGQAEEGEEDEGQHPEDWAQLSRFEVIKAIVGSELAQYVRN